MIGIVVRGLALLIGVHLLLMGGALAVGRLLPGAMLAFSSDRDGNGFDIYLADVNTGALVQIASPELINSSPTWSPDGQKLVWLRGGSLFTYYALDMGSYRVYPLTDLTISSPSTAWSPDGTTILFERGAANGWTNIMALEVASGQTTSLTDENQGYESSPAWLPDNRHFVYAYQIDGLTNRVGLYDMTDHTFTQLTDEQSVIPSVSPDGQTFTYYVDRTTLMIRSLAGTETQRLQFREPIDYVQPVWSPDSTQVAFGRDVRVVAIYDLTTQTVRDLTPTGVYEYGPVWSPDGHSLLTVESTRRGTRLMIVDVASGERRPFAYLSPFVADRMPAWRP